MSEMIMMNPEQMKEVSGGTTHGRLTKTEIAAVEFGIKLSKYKGYTLGQYLEVLMRSHQDNEYKEAAEKYARTFWDRIESF